MAPVKVKSSFTNPEDWIHFDDAAALLKVKKTTLTNYVCSGKIPPNAVRQGIGTKFFHRPTLQGLN